VYRYRLALDAHNDGVSSRVVEGFRLRKDTWLMSDDPIDFKSFKDLIEEQSRDSKEEFDRLDIEDARRLVEAPPADRPAPVAEHTVEPQKDEPSSVEKKLRSRGFSSAELRGRSQAELEELLAFDATIISKRGC
jgi:hypothetical protein